MRLDDELADDAQTLARAEAKSLNETVKLALSEAVDVDRNAAAAGAGVTMLGAGQNRPHERD